MSELNREIGGLIRNYRKAKNLTQDELSEKICKSKSTISKYEMNIKCCSHKFPSFKIWMVDSDPHTDL